MAKLYKVEMYILDTSDSYENLDEIMIKTEYGVDNAFFVPFNAKSVDIEWDDNIDLNYTTATVETYRKYFEKDEIEIFEGDGFDIEYNTYVLAYCIDVNSWFITKQRCWFFQFDNEFTSFNEAKQFYVDNYNMILDQQNLMLQACGQNPTEKVFLDEEVL